MVIALQRLNGTEFVLNAHLIETIEATPDTIIRLNSGKTYMVKNSIADVVKKCVKYRQLCGQTIAVREQNKGELE